MKKSSKIMLASLVAIFGVTAVALTTDGGKAVTAQIENVVNPVSTDFEFVKENQFPITIGHGSFDKYQDVESMNEESVLVAEVQIKDQKTVYLRENPPLVETWSEAEIKQVFKGDESLKSVTIAELGGVMDMSKSKGNEKRSGGTPVKMEPFLEDAVEGSPVMKKGNTYMVFLIHGAPKDVYVVTGTIQGKIRISDTTNKGVVTIDPEHFTKHKGLFWFQHRFAGKDKQEIAEILKKLQ